MEDMQVDLKQRIERAWQNENPSEFIIPVTFIFCLSSILSAVLRLGTFWTNGKLAAIIGGDIGSEAYYKSLQQSYEKYINSNSSDLIAAISIQMNLTIQALESVLYMFSAAIVFCSSVLNV